MGLEDDKLGHVVFGDVGGWISGPSLDAEQLQDRPIGGPRFGLNVGAWMKEYGARWVLQGGFDGFGFVCWRRSGTGRPAGQPIKAGTLDELAELVDHREPHSGEAPRDGRGERP
jgi:hypothetical protein